MNTFPLNKLPQGIFLRTVKSMEITDQLTYSLCSKNTKKMIKSLNLRAEKIKFDVSDYIVVQIGLTNSISFWISINLSDTFLKDEFSIPREITICVSSGTIVMSARIWNFPNFKFKEWLHHFCEVLHHLRIDHFDLYEEIINVNHIKPIQKVIEGLPVGRLAISRQFTYNFAKKALESFPIYEKLSLAQIPFDGNELNKLLVQNLESLCISSARRLKINQVLASNSVRIQLNHSKFNEKDFNRLLKLWIRGSNPRLKYFSTWGQPQNGSVLFNENVILKGIKHNQIPLDSKEVHKNYTSETYCNEIKLAGGYRIKKVDGTTAVIVETGSEFEFIVQ